MQINLNQFGHSPQKRVELACQALLAGRGIVVLDDPDRENEGDLIYAAQTLSVDAMTRLIVDCSGIVCLALPQHTLDRLGLGPMVQNNTSQNQTAFTQSIEAKQGVTTGVSAADRTQTVLTAIADSAKPSDLARPGHVFPLLAQDGGALTRRGHTEAGVDLCRLAGLKPAAVLCELMEPDGSMSKGEQLVHYATRHQLPLLTIEDLVQVLEQRPLQVA